MAAAAMTMGCTATGRGANDGPSPAPGAVRALPRGRCSTAGAPQAAGTTVPPREGPWPPRRALAPEVAGLFWRCFVGGSGSLRGLHVGERRGSDAQRIGGRRLSPVVVLWELVPQSLLLPSCRSSVAAKSSPRLFFAACFFRLPAGIRAAILNKNPPPCVGELWQARLLDTHLWTHGSKLTAANLAPVRISDRPREAVRSDLTAPVAGHALPPAPSRPSAATCTSPLSSQVPCVTPLYRAHATQRSAAQHFVELARVAGTAQHTS